MTPIDRFQSRDQQLCKFLETRGQCLTSLEISKEVFYVFRRIKSENSRKWNKFKTVMHLHGEKQSLSESCGGSYRT